MVWTTLDNITKRYLLAHNLPIHYYVEVLTHSAYCLQELTMDTLRVINSIELPVESGGVVNLPNDCLDWVAVGQRMGQKVRPLAETKSIVGINNHDSDGNVINYNQSTNAALDAFQTWPTTFYWTNVNEFGEYLGRAFGYDTEGANPNGYKGFRERGQLQMLETYQGTTVIVDYISDGQSVNDATRVTPLAQSAIEAYVAFKMSPNRNNLQSPEGQQYAVQVKQLRRRLLKVTIPDIKRAIQSGYKLSVKN